MLETSLSAYFTSARGLRSTDPSVRRPAISALLELARGPAGAVQASAERALTKEFGPYAVSEGLAGCAGSAEAVIACCAEDRDCQSCPWLWIERAKAFENYGNLFGPGASEAIG